jgi:hypothetical protein
LILQNSARWFSRKGKVAEGVLSILQELPVVNVKVDDLPALVGNPSMFSDLPPPF